MSWQSKMKNSDSYQSALLKTFRNLGLLLLIMLSLILVLSGCGKTVVVRSDCPPYPQPPKELMQPAQNLDLVPQSMLPNAKK